MTTNLEIIEPAYRLIGVVPESGAVSPEQGSVGLKRLNQMMSALAIEDVDIGYFEQDSTTDECPIPSWAERGIISKLAKDLLGVYPTAVLSGEFMDDNLNGFNVIRRICMNQKLEGQDTTYLGAGAGNWNLRTNILTG